MKKITPRLISWASIIDEKTEAQARTTATMPFIFPHLALMPDAHLGLGATVGSVIPTERAVMPAAVGVDIGCGMIAVKTQFTASQLPDDRKAVREQIERAIPTSAGAYNRKVVATAEPRIQELEEMAAKRGFDPAAYGASWKLQLGTLGSGNHPNARPPRRCASRRNRRRGPSSRSASMRRMPCGCSCTRARVA